MLTFLSWAMIITFLVLVMAKKLSPFAALVVVPIAFGLIGAFFGLYSEQATELFKLTAEPNLWHQIRAVGEFTLAGMRQTSTTAIMLLFAIFFFAIMLNAGMFDPITKWMVKLAGGDPLKVLIATGILSAAVSLNGDGTTTTLIVCTAFVPLYKKLNIKLLYLAVVCVLMNTIMNLLPWGGPTARVISVLGNVGEAEILRALVPGMVVATIYMMGVSAYLGLKERKRVGIVNLSDAELEAITAPKDEEDAKLRRPHLFWVNVVLTAVVLTLLMMEDTFHSAVIFMVGTVLALLINYPKLKDQKARIQDNAGDALQVVILVIGAGVLTGIFTRTGMSDALVTSLINIIPDSLGRFWGLVVAVVSAPGTFFLSNDAFYYGVLPVMADIGMQYGFTALELGVASLLGQAFHLLSPLVAFIYLLLQLTETEMLDWQKESAKWATGIFVIFVGVAAILNIVPLFK